MKKFRIREFILIISMMYLYLGNVTAGNIERIEPPFWWTGMSHPYLQLLVHGDDIGKYSVRSNHSELKVLKTNKTDSPNYLFVDLDIRNCQPGNYILELWDDEQLVESLSYEFKVRDEKLKNREGFNAADVLYLITPDRFVNGDVTNDEVEGMREGLDRNAEYGRHGGDIKGITDNLDYIADMGFTAIWLNPVLENDQIESSYHGYSTTDYYRIDPRFGSNQEYVELSKKAGDKDIKLIMDIIVNHCGSSHWWMQDLPFQDWLNYQDQEYQQTNHRKSTLNDPYVSQSDRKIMTDGWFVPTMPDLNQRNPFMSEYLIQNSIWWIEYARLAGIRQDTYSYPYRDFMSDWTCRIMSEYPNFNIVAEEWTSNQATIAYWLQNKVNYDGYTSCLRSAMDFPMNAVLASALNEDEGWDRGLIKLYDVVANDFIYPNASDLVIFPDNHDMSRVFTQLNEDVDLFKMALTYILTMRGTPQLYYGTEILMSHPGTTSHGIIRSDFPGGWQGDLQNVFTGKGMEQEQVNAQTWLRKMLTWRKSATAIHSGKLIHFIPADGIYVYFRYNQDSKYMIVLNKNNRTSNLHLGRFSEMLEGHSTITNVLSNTTFALKQDLNIAGRNAFVYEVK